MSDTACDSSIKKRVYYLKASNNSSTLHTSIEGIMDPAKTLIDSGSSRNFIDISYARRHSLCLIELQHQRAIIGIDGQEIEDKIWFKTTLNITIEGRTFKQRFYAMPLGDTEVILGMTWLKDSNPDISWEDLSIKYRDTTEKGRAATITPEHLTTIPKEFHEFGRIFDAESFKELPPHRDYDCAIEFKEDSDLPKPGKMIPLSRLEEVTLDEFEKGELRDGKIRPSKSSVASPCFYVKKADGGLRLVTDYRKINEITKSDKFPLPLRGDLIEKLKDAKIFTKLDLRWGFNNIRIKEGDEWKTAFRTKNGLYEYTVMPFGLKNAPAVFQRFMNDILRDLLDVYVVVYLDDILIYSKNREDHEKHVKEVLKRIQDNNLFLKPSKCFFYVTTITYIGIVISPEGISMEKDKIKAIAEWKPPNTVKQTQAFLGFANFYRRFVRNFSTLAKPLTALTRKDTKWRWGEEEQGAFEAIKTEITKDPVLVHPNPNKPYFLETNASGVAMGAILSQKQADRYLHPIAFMSESFNDAQRNYDTHDKELLAIICSLEHWHIFLEGTIEPITVYTDHRNLEYWKEARTWNRRHARWYQLIASFDFHIVYRAGKMSAKPDALSRRHDHPDIPNKAQIMITAERFQGFKAETSLDIISAIQEAQSEDESLETLITTTQKKDTLPASVQKQFAKYTWEEGLRKNYCSRRERHSHTSIGATS